MGLPARTAVETAKSVPAIAAFNTQRMMKATSGEISNIPTAGIILRSGASQVHPETVMALLMAGVFGFAIFLARKVLLGRLRS